MHTIDTTAQQHCWYSF